MVRSSAKMRDTTFLEFDTCHQKTPLEMLYSITLTNLYGQKREVVRLVVYEDSYH